MAVTSIAPVTVKIEKDEQDGWAKKHEDSDQDEGEEEGRELARPTPPRGKRHRQCIRVPVTDPL